MVKKHITVISGIPLLKPAIISMCVFQAAFAGWVNIRTNSNLDSLGTGPRIVVCPPLKDIIYGFKWQQFPVKSTDGGVTWEQCGQDPGSALINHGTTEVKFDPENNSTYWECGMYGGNGLCKTVNDGDFYTAFSSSSGNCDGMGIDFTDPLRKTIIMGGHEAKKTVYKSNDGGITWTNIGGGLPGVGFSCNIYLVNATTYLAAESGYQGANGMFRTTDGGLTWTKVCSQLVAGYPVQFSNGKIYWTIQGNLGIVMSSDNGATWTKTSSGGSWTASVWPGVLDEMPRGQIITLSPNRNQLLSSSDDGKTWTVISALPFTISATAAAAGVAYSKARNCVFVWGGGALYRYDFDAASAVTNLQIQSITGTKRNHQIIYSDVIDLLKNNNSAIRIFDIEGRIIQSNSSLSQSSHARMPLVLKGIY